jgi:hypothetical protein
MLRWLVVVAAAVAAMLLTERLAEALVVGIAFFMRPSQLAPLILLQLEVAVLQKHQPGLGIVAETLRLQLAQLLMQRTVVVAVAQIHLLLLQPQAAGVVVLRLTVFSI